MIYDALLVTDLPTELGPPLPTPFLQGVENLLFSGSWANRRSTCPLSAAVVLARGLQVLREANATDIRVLDDAGCVLEQAAWTQLDEPTLRWPETLPTTWTEQPCEFELRGLFRERGIAAALTLRYTPRHDPEHAALTGSLRALWDVAPSDGGERDFQRSFEAALSSGGTLRELARRLRDRGEQRAQDMLRALEAAFETAPGSSWGRLIALHGYGEHPERFADLLAGLPEERRLHLALLERRLARSHRRWPAIDPEGIPGHLHRGSFTPSAEVLHVA